MTVTQEQIDRVVDQMGDVWKDRDVLRSYVDLMSFVAYCLDNPTQRFWQALRNWSGASSVYMETKAGMIDTFSIELTTPARGRGRVMDCDCEFDNGFCWDRNEEDEPWHFKRVCLHCGKTWCGLHCEHDQNQNPCPRCGLVPLTSPAGQVAADTK